MALLVLQGTHAASAPLASACAALVQGAGKNVTIDAAEAVQGGSIATTAPEPPIANLPPFCRIRGHIRPVAGSRIGFELWLPQSVAWNGRYHQVGNGGYAGVIPVRDMAPPLRQGFAVAATDDGHQAAAIADVSWIRRNPEALIDFVHRAVHETSVAAKALIARHYGRPARYSYFNGCSQGGREGLMAAQRYPADFDGIIAGAPAQYLTRLTAAHVWAQQVLFGKGEVAFSAADARFLQSAVLAQCDRAGDGIADGLVGDPRACRLHLEKLRCSAKGGSSCLSTVQIDALRRLYAGPRGPGWAWSYPGYQPGAEADEDLFSMKNALLSGPASIDFQLGGPFFGELAYGNEGVDPLSIDLGRELPLLEAKLWQGETLDSLFNVHDPERLAPFFRRGGKLIQYHGWADFGIAPYSPLFYERAMASRALVPRAGPQSQAYRLFMVPGMHHCMAGPGATAFGQNAIAPAAAADADHDVVRALMAWVERGKAPERIVATHYRNGLADQGIEFQRPLCPYPLTARYSGRGHPGEAGRFRCVDLKLKPPS